MSTYSAIIAGTGSYLPEHRLTNEELSKMVDTNDEWIVQRTGIRERRMAAKEESTATLATEAGKRALEAAGRTAWVLRPELVGADSYENVSQAYYEAVHATLSRKITAKAAVADLHSKLLRLARDNRSGRNQAAE